MMIVMNIEVNNLFIIIIIIRTRIMSNVRMVITDDDD